MGAVPVHGPPGGIRFSGRLVADARRSGKRGEAPAHGWRGRDDMAKSTPTQFFQQVRAETAKVTWPSRRETLITTAMVFLMVLLAAIFFMVADQIMQFGVGLLLKIGQ